MRSSTQLLGVLRIRPWLLPVVLSVLILCVALYLVFRRAQASEPDPRLVPVLVRTAPGLGREPGRGTISTFFWDGGWPDRHGRV